MTLSCRFLTDVNGVNSFEYASSAEIYEGDEQNIYLQLIDSGLDRSDQGFFPAGRRYCPPDGSVLTILLKNIDDAKKITRVATQAYPVLDASIWYIPILGTDPLAGTVTMEATLVEPTRTLHFKNAKGVLVRVR
jgi:hypothetical protein